VLAHAAAPPSPAQVIIGLLRAAMVKTGAKDFLIDGFPRALDQAEMFEKMVKAPDMVLAFECPEVSRAEVSLALQASVRTASQQPCSVLGPGSTRVLAWEGLTSIARACTALLRGKACASCTSLWEPCETSR
jgi:hypothetical protein